MDEMDLKFRTFEAGRWRRNWVSPNGFKVTLFGPPFGPPLYSKVAPLGSADCRHSSLEDLKLSLGMPKSPVQEPKTKEPNGPRDGPDLRAGLQVMRESKITYSMITQKMK